MRNAGRRVPLLVLLLGVPRDRLHRAARRAAGGQPERGAGTRRGHPDVRAAPGRRLRARTQRRGGVLRADNAQSACQDALGAFVRGGYRLFDFSEDPQPVGDTATFCETEAADLSPGSSTPSVIAIAFPPGESTRYASDGIGVVLTPAHAGDAFPKRTHLRLSDN